MNSVLCQMLQRRQVVTDTGETLPLHSQIPELECEIIQAWIRAFRPRRLLEIGMAYGVSSLFIRDALQGDEETTHHIIDPHQRTHWGSLGLLNLQRAGYQNQFVFHEEPSELCLPRLLQEKRSFDFAIIDGFHTFDHAFVDFFYVNRLLECGGIVVMDDIQYPSIRRVVSFIKTLECYRELPLPAVLASDRRIRVRKMVGVPASRVIGFQKMAIDHRDSDWYEDF